jgi:hypothetical protein
MIGYKQKSQPNDDKIDFIKNSCDDHLNLKMKQKPVEKFQLILGKSKQTLDLI